MSVCSSGPLGDITNGVLDSSQNSIEQGELEDSIFEDTQNVPEILASDPSKLAADTRLREPHTMEERRRSADVESMMLELGQLDSSHFSDLSLGESVEDYKTAIKNRDFLISRMSSCLQSIRKEREEDVHQSSNLELEILSLKSQVKQAVEKASKNRSYRSRCTALQKENENLRARLHQQAAEMELRNASVLEKEAALATITGDLTAANGQLAELRARVGSLTAELAVADSDRRVLQGELAKIQTQHAEQIRELKEEQERAVMDLKERQEQELQTLADRYEEQQVVEINLLDMELMSLREERATLLDTVARFRAEKEGGDERQSAGSDRADEEQKLIQQQQTLLAKAEAERNLLAERLRSLESQWREEVSVRQSLEQRLMDISSALDETGYNIFPPRVRQTLRQSASFHPSNFIATSLQLSHSESSTLQPESILSEPESTTSQPTVTPSRQTLSPTNITQLSNECDNSDCENTPTHCPANSVKAPLETNQPQDSEIVESLKVKHELEMCELRRYFENYCREIEKKYCQELEELVRSSHSRVPVLPTLTRMLPLSLEVSHGQLDYSELESLSPPSLDSSQHNSLGGILSSAVHSRQNSDSLGNVEKDQPLGTGTSSELEVLRSQVETLRSELQLLKQAPDEDDPNCRQSDGQRCCPTCRSDLEHEIAVAVAALKQRLEDEHSRKYEAVANQIQQAQAGQLASLRSQHARELAQLREQLQEKAAVASQPPGSRQTVDVGQEEALDSSSSAVALLPMDGSSGDSSAPPVAKKLLADLEKLEEDKARLLASHRMMKELITDLVKHYSLSEKQAQALSESTFFHNYYNTKSFHLSSREETALSESLLTPLKYLKRRLAGPAEDVSGRSSRSQLREENGPRPITPNQSILGPEELSDLLADGTFMASPENSEAIFLELQRQVKRSNEQLEAVGLAGVLEKLSGLITPPEPHNEGRPAHSYEEETELGENFVGLEAGRLEVEKARLEVELAAARQRIQELELLGRNSLGRSEVISGLGGDLSTGDERSEEVEALGETRDKVARLLSQLEGGERDLPVQEYVLLLGELLLHSDQVSSQAKQEKADLSQQLEAADKQLRATRQFLEEQALEREAEREEWEKRLHSFNPSKNRKSGEKTGGMLNDNEQMEEDGTDGEGGRRAETRAGLVQELAATVDKIYELREIIRNLETQLEARDRAAKVTQQQSEELRTALSDAILTSQVVQQELELLRANSGDGEIAEHIKGLEEQLATKSQELQKHRTNQLYLQEIKAHLRGFQERLELATRELEASVREPAGSSDSSRSSSPVLRSGVSFEDIGGGGQEMEEDVFRLQKQLLVTEKAKVAAVQKIRGLEEANRELAARLEQLQVSSQQEVADRIVSAQQLWNREREQLERELLQLRQLGNIEDIQEENRVLQERVMSQQVQISALQADRQAQRHKLETKVEGAERVEALLQERDRMAEQLQQLQQQLHAQELEKQLRSAELREMRSLISELQDESREASMTRLQRDKAELEEVNARLTQQLSQARAAQLAAAKAQLPALVESLVHEKNQEIEALHRQLRQLQQQRDSNPTSGMVSGESCLSLEDQMREASAAARPTAELSYLTSQVEERTGLQAKLGPILEASTGTAALLTDSQQSDSYHLRLGDAREIRDYSGNEESVQNSAATSGNGQRVPANLAETTDSSGHMSLPTVNITLAEQPEAKSQEPVVEEMEAMEKLLHQRNQEIESLSVIIHEKENLVYELQDRALEAEEMMGRQRNSIQELSESRGKLQADLATKSGELAELKERLDVTLAKMDQMKSVLDEKSAIEEELTRRSAQQAEQLTQARSDLQRIDKSLDPGEEIRRLREENADQRDGLANLHAIIDSCHADADLRRAELTSCVKELEIGRHEIFNLKSELEKTSALANELRSDLEARISVEKALRGELETKNKQEVALLQLLEKKANIEEQFRKQVEQQSNIEKDLRGELERKAELDSKRTASFEQQSHVEKALRSELSVCGLRIQELEAAVGKEQEELASCQITARELADRYWSDLQARTQEMVALQAEFTAMKDTNEMLERRCQETEAVRQELFARIKELEQSLMTRETEGRERAANRRSSEAAIEVGSLDDLTDLVQRELEVSSELDQSLLNQLAAGDKDIPLRDDGGGLNSFGRSEVQRLLQKVEEEGAAVLSLSEKLFLFQQARGDAGQPEHEQPASRGEIFQFRLQQERVVAEDLKTALDAEKRHSLELLSALSQERQQRRDMEEELAVLRRQLKQRSLSLVSDSENEEFLNTIEAQKRHIESLEESLQKERENFEQLQQVLSVERRRQRHDSPDSQAPSVSSGEASSEVSALIISHLRRELDEERRRVNELLLELDAVKRQQQVKSSSGRRSEPRRWGAETNGGPELAKADVWQEAWRIREYELERLVAELELKVELLEREEGRQRDLLHQMEIELLEERQKTNTGVSAEQLARMRQMNSFLELNLRESSEMLASLTRLQEEKQQLARTVTELRQQQQRPDAYGKYLRSESYRKALVWQKRYLLVHIAGGYTEAEPVLRLGRERLLPEGRFRAAVQVVIAVCRMRFLVRRWRSGKRAGARLAPVSISSSRTWSLASTPAPEPVLSSFEESRPRPDTLAIRSSHLSLGGSETVLPSSRTSSLLRSSTGKTGVRRSASLRESESAAKERALGLRNSSSRLARGDRSASLLRSPSSLSTSSSRPPIVTGRTPPTRDTSGRCGSLTCEPSSPVLPRRNLSSQFLNGPARHEYGTGSAFK